MASYNKIATKYADNEEFCVELSRLTTEGIQKEIEKATQSPE